MISQNVLSLHKQRREKTFSRYTLNLSDNEHQTIKQTPNLYGRLQTFAQNRTEGFVFYKKY